MAVLIAALAVHGDVAELVVVVGEAVVVVEATEEEEDSCL